MWWKLYSKQMQPRKQGSLFPSFQAHFSLERGVCRHLSHPSPVPWSALQKLYSKKERHSGLRRSSSTSTHQYMQKLHRRHGRWKMLGPGHPHFSSLIRGTLHNVQGGQAENTRHCHTSPVPTCRTGLSPERSGPQSLTPTPEQQCGHSPSERQALEQRALSLSVRGLTLSAT